MRPHCILSLIAALTMNIYMGIKKQYLHLFNPDLTLKDTTMKPLDFNSELSTMNSKDLLKLQKGLEDVQMQLSMFALLALADRRGILNIAIRSTLTEQFHNHSLEAGLKYIYNNYPNIVEDASKL